MQIKVECVGGPVDGVVYAVSDFQDYFSVIQPPPFHIWDKPAMLDYVDGPPIIHTYRIDHHTRKAIYKGEG